STRLRPKSTTSRDRGHIVRTAFADYLARLERSMGVGCALERERRSDLDAQVPGVEVLARALEDHPLTFPVLTPAEHRWRRHPGERHPEVAIAHRLDRLLFPRAFDVGDEIPVGPHQGEA